jgi:hypothetical protein
MGRGKTEGHRCCACSFEFDAWNYKLNNDGPKHFSPFAKIEVIPEEEKSDRE